MTATLKNLTIRQAAAACLFMAFLAGALLVILKTAPISFTGLITVLFLLFMLFIGTGTLSTFGFLLWLAPDRTHAQRWFVRTMLFIVIGTLGTLGILLWLAPDRIIVLPAYIVFSAMLWITDGHLFAPDGSGWID